MHRRRWPRKTKAPSVAGGASCLVRCLLSGVQDTRDHDDGPPERPVVVVVNRFQCRLMRAI
jgi:hypothetical protein